MKPRIVYVHGKGGSAGEAAHYAALLPAYETVGFDYKAKTPREAKEEFPAYFDGACREAGPVFLIANSIGAYFSMHALTREVERAFLISPIVDMAELIGTMMTWAGVTERDLEARREIPTDFGETLSWGYLSYVREHPITWDVPTEILYGGKDNLTPRASMAAFARRIGANLTVMEDGEHWFHTEKQLAFLDSWLLCFL